MPLRGIPSIMGAGKQSTSASFNKGWDFRLTSGFVTDPANCTYDIGENYPTTRNGATFGWDATPGLDGRNRSAGIDPRLAGIVFCSNTAAVFTWRLDLPAAGNYIIRLALGDGTTAAQKNYFRLKDGGSTLISFSPVATGGNWADATGTLLNSTDWPTSNTGVQVAFAGTTLTVLIGGTVDTDSSCIDFLGVVSA